MSSVRDTTRRVTAALTKPAGRPSLHEPMDTVQELTHIDDPEEPSTVLTRMAAARPNPLADLESLLPVRHDFDDLNGFITLCNDLLVLNSQDHLDPTRRSIKIPGTTGVFISPNQLYHAWHLLSQRGRYLRGGILADEAGTGKTYVYFTAALLRALVWESKRAVQLYWSGKGKKKVGRHAEHHLPEGANGRSCPSQRPGGIVCYCVPGSLTRTISDHTPSGVSALYVASETWPDILNLVQTAGLNPSMYQLCLVHNNAPKRFTRSMGPLVQTLSHGAQTDLKDFSPASYIFITTLESPRLRNIFAGKVLNCGIALIDEAHQILRIKDSLTFRMAEEFSHHGADVWFVSATPFNGCTLEDWVPPVKCIAPRRASATQRLAETLDLAKLSGEFSDVLSFQAQFNTIFDRDLVLRHFGFSKFLGKSISDVQNIVPRVISRTTPTQHRFAVQELSRQISWKDPQLHDPTQRGLMYLVSLFPAAAELILEDPITYDTASIRDLIRQTKNRLRIEESEQLRRLADRIIQNSPKLDYILEELKRMAHDPEERARIDHQATHRLGAGEDLKMKKMVIITPTVVSAVFLYLALIKHRPDVALIHNWVSAQEKEQVVNNFKSLSAAKLVKHNRVLIAPFAAIGTGANLQVASYQILTSPLPDRASQVQAFARTNRSGQRLRPRHKVLALEDSPVDRIVLAAHATLDIESDPFNINEPLRIAGTSALGSPSSLDNPDSPTGPVEEQMSSTHGSTLGVNEAAIFQNALTFSPRPSTGNNSQEREFFSETTLSSKEANEALLLQNASFWAPQSSTDQSNADTHGPYGPLTDDSSSDDLYSYIDGRHGEQARPVSPMSNHTFGPPRPVSAMSSRTFGTPEQPTYTPAAGHYSVPTFERFGHLSLPPLPAETKSVGKDDSPTLGGLFPPPPSGPRARFDVGASLTRPPPLDLVNSRDRDDAVSLRSVIEFELVERPLTPYPEEMLEHSSDNAQRGRDLGNVEFDVDDLIRTARASSARLWENGRSQLGRQNSDDWARLEEEARQRDQAHEDERFRLVAERRAQIMKDLEARRR
ncbi:hypothetical protein KVR01_000531 [Diaporthe batatas]|uniref:uncharacterized protein n=1 Tax=Diaporthe batatas TaxID=748121 RepID=UPI001D03AFE2|nr:uncharacterized protein KVR01_000531 [Diaporthe batatas]KAG8169786.1 hypothetical protein KVR01_000531 [Diaporthe batatas]